MHQDNDVTFTADLIINLEVIHSFERHGMLLGFGSAACEDGENGKFISVMQDSVHAVEELDVPAVDQ
jgi:hypothetical protein